MSPGIIMGDIGDPQFQCIFQKFVAGKVVSAGGLIVFAFRGKMDFSVFPQTAAAQSGKGGIIFIKGFGEGSGGGSLTGKRKSFGYDFSRFRKEFFLFLTFDYLL